MRLVGVGRAFLRDYVLSSESGGGTTTQEELSDILAKVWEFDDEGKRDEEVDNAADLDPDIDPGRRLPVIMAEYDVFLDDPPVLADRTHPNDGQDASGNGASSAIAELYRGPFRRASATTSRSGGNWKRWRITVSAPTASSRRYPISRVS